MTTAQKTAGLATLLALTTLCPRISEAQFNFRQLGRVVNSFSQQGSRFQSQPLRNLPQQFVPREVQNVVRDVERLVSPPSQQRPHVEPDPSRVVGEIVGHVERLIRPQVVPSPPICITPPPECVIPPPPVCVTPPPTCVIPPPICVTPPGPGEPVVGPVPGPEQPGIPTATTDATPTEDRTVIEVGQTLSIPVDGLGQQPGDILFDAGGLVLRAKIVDWQPTSVTFQAPHIDLAAATPATLIVQLANRQRLGEVPVTLAPATTHVGRTRVPVGSQLTLEGRDYGILQGTVHIQVGPLKMQTKLIEWTGDKAVFEVPALDLAKPTEAEIVVANGRGEVAERTDILLVAAS